MSENPKEINDDLNEEEKEKHNIIIDSDSSQLSNFEEKVKNDDIISSSSDDENNIEKENKEFKSKDKDKDPKNLDNIKLLGNKRALSKEHKDNKNPKNSNNNNKYKIYNHFDSNKKFQPSLDVPLVTYDLFCELFNEKDQKKNLNLTEDDYKKLYEEYKINHEKKNSEEFFNYHKNDEWFLDITNLIIKKGMKCVKRRLKYFSKNMMKNTI